MERELIEQIANQIVRNEILTNWLYWALFLGVLAIGGFFGNLVGSYAAKRGELSATSTKFTEILEQLRKSTHATEEIRSAVSLGEWSKKEQTTLRRIKLEELVLAARAVDEWWQTEHSRVVFDAPEKSTLSPMPKFQAVGRLYFPELTEQLTEFLETYSSVHIWLLGIGLQLIEAQRENIEAGPVAMGTAKNTIREAARDEMPDQYKPFAVALSKLELEAARLMESITAVEQVE